MSTSTARRITVTCLCAFALFLGTGTAAQKKGETAGPGEPFQFQSKVRIVLVPVVVRGTHGLMVGNLNKEDFQVFDRGKLQVISGFSIQKRSPENASVTGIPAAADGSNAVEAKEGAGAVPERFVALLFDDLHLTPSDVMRVRPAAARMLGASLESTDAAAVLSTSGRVNTGFTRDQSKLRSAVLTLRQAANYAHARGCPDVEAYEAYLIHDLNDPTALEAAMQDVVRCAPDVTRVLAETMARTAATDELNIAE